MFNDPRVQAALVGVALLALGLVGAVLIRLTTAVSQSKLTMVQLFQMIRHEPVAAGGGARRNVTLPAYDQLHDPLPDGSLATDRFNECGEECVAEIIQWVHGVEVSADAIRYQARGAPGGALTTGADLVLMLARNNVRAVLGAQDVGIAEKYLLGIVADRRLVIVLGNWVSAGVPHWVIVYNASVNGCTVSDPWGGRRYNLAWADFRRLYLGSTVEVVTVPDPALSN